MAHPFEELGLSPAMGEAVAGAGYDRASAAQRASVPVMRRGGNAVLRASSGSGALTGVLLALLDRHAEASGGGGAADGDAADPGAAPPPPAPWALVLAPTAARAGAIAQAASRCGRATGARGAALGTGWNTAGAVLLAATPPAVLRAVERSALKLDGLQALVLDAASHQFALFGATVLETLLGTVPRDAQRIIITSALDEAVSDFVEAHARRALHVPARLADPASAPPQTPRPGGALHYVAAPNAAQQLDVLGELLRAGAAGQRAVVTRSGAALATLRDALALRGHAVDRGAGAVLLAAEARPSAAAAVIGFGAPLDGESLAHAFAAGDTFVVQTAELAHLRQLAAAGGFELRAVAPAAVEHDEIDAFRAGIRRALEQEDVAANLLVLEPLFAERSPAEVAAALSALLRRRGAAPGARAAAGGGAALTAAAQETVAAGTAIVRLFISSGSRDGLRPGDLVGAIAGETGLSGGDIGRIDIRDTFSVVEVPAAAADQVIRKLNGTTFRGRSLRVDYDRRGVSGPDAAGERRPAGGERGGARKPAPRGGSGAPRGGGPRGGGEGKSRR